MDEILRVYYADNARKLHKIVDGMLLQFGGLSDKDKDDFYSLANEVFVDVIRKYDYKQSFESFLYSCLIKKVKAEITRRNRYKRKTDRLSISIDMPVGENEDKIVADILVADFDMDKVIFGEDDSGSTKVERYLRQLTKRQRKIVTLLMESYGAGEIQKMLCMTKREYTDAMSGIHAYENISVLF